MNTRTPLARAIRLAIGGAAGLSAALAAPLTLAQDDQTVYVVGSRIGRVSDFESPSPVVPLSRETLFESGYNNLQQVLEKLPPAGNGTFSTRGNNQDSTANGAASISLRGLGADATLVLVNGRRVAISSFAESITTIFVDINTIPGFDPSLAGDPKAGENVYKRSGRGLYLMRGLMDRVEFKNGGRIVELEKRNPLNGTS